MIQLICYFVYLFTERPDMVASSSELKLYLSPERMKVYEQKNCLHESSIELRLGLYHHIRDFRDPIAKKVSHKHKLFFGNSDSNWY